MISPSHSPSIRLRIAAAVTLAMVATLMTVGALVYRSTSQAHGGDAVLLGEGQGDVPGVRIRIADVDA